MRSRRVARPLALLLCCLLASPAFSPLYAAERAAALGRIVAAPPAQVNGLAVPGDATLLDGDRLSTGPNAWARVLLARDEQIHLGAQSEARATRQGDSLTLELTQGRVAVRTRGSDLRVWSNGLEIVPTANHAVWEVARLREDLTLVASLQGSVEVRSANRSVEVRPGQSVQLRTGLLESAQEPTRAESDAGPNARTRRRRAIALVILGGPGAGVAIAVALADGAQVVSPSVP